MLEDLGVVVVAHRLGPEPVDRDQGPVDGPDGSPSWDRLCVAMWSPEEFAGEVVAHLGDVVAVEPPALRRAVIARLEQVTGERP